MFDIMSVDSGICINGIVSTISFELLETSYLKLKVLYPYPAVGVAFGDVSHNVSKDSCSRAVGKFNDEGIVCFGENSSGYPLFW